MQVPNQTDFVQDKLPAPCLITLRDGPGTKRNLIFFHFAGGSAYYFRGWATKITEGTSVYAMQLPGRECRSAEAFVLSIHEVVDELVGAMTKLLQKPCIFFGHSMGSLIAFELSKKLKKDFNIEPNYLILSGKNSPQLPINEKTYHLSDEDFIRKLAQYEGTPKIVLNDPELMKHFLPRLRADSHILDTYVYNNEYLLSCPFWVIAGEQDVLTNKEGLLAWQNLTSGRFIMDMYSGGHFFITENQTEIVDRINVILENGI